MNHDEMVTTQKVYLKVLYKEKGADVLACKQRMYSLHIFLVWSIDILVPIFFVKFPHLR